MIINNFNKMKSKIIKKKIFFLKLLFNIINEFVYKIIENIIC